MPIHGVTVDPQSGGVRPVETQDGAAIGLVAHCSEQTEGDLILLRPSTDLTAHDDGSGSIGPIYDMIRRHTQAPVIVSCVDQATLADASGSAGSYTYAFRFLQAEAELGVKPKILAQARVGNVGQDLSAVADRMRAVAFIDGPNTDDASAIADVANYSSQRVSYGDPSVIDTQDNVIGSSVLYAALTANANFWETVSNEAGLINGIKGLSRPIGADFADPSSQAEVLAAAKVNTIIRKNGWRLWGGLSASADPNFKFLSVARTDDVIADSIQEAFLWAVDKGITRNFVEEVVGSVQAFLRDLKARGAIIDGTAWADPALNTATSMQLGNLYIDYDFTPIYPARSIVMRRHLTNEYLAQIFA